MKTTISPVGAGVRAVGTTTSSAAASAADVWRSDDAVGLQTLGCLKGPHRRLQCRVVALVVQIAHGEAQPASRRDLEHGYLSTGGRSHAPKHYPVEVESLGLSSRPQGHQPRPRPWPRATRGRVVSLLDDRQQQYHTAPQPTSSVTAGPTFPLIV